MTADELTRIFSYHPPHGDQAARYEQLRSAARHVAQLVVALCPASRERSLAVTHLQEAVMFANAAIAIHEAPPPPAAAAAIDNVRAA